MKTREEVYGVLCDLLVNMFEVEADDISGSANLYEDLDVDSIDAVDLVVELKSITGKQIDPDEFNSVRTVDDVVSTVVGILGIE
ncbi:acyl carrier protein [Pseudohalioglobus sediminis]|uniref:Acyl carrier protein n=1 Tax=Pseudohalioglobus sediminis TaxID=2606449 RepID=A0A5B0WTS8_9GAMM|nr:acyl carrier protein [Pseudohalioglobus sediminis]KAA1190484.1 acyl carrier protein [Pseudohalioglobus sediminis]